jgi:hypothetical protein
VGRHPGVGHGRLKDRGFLHATLPFSDNATLRRFSFLS